MRKTIITRNIYKKKDIYRKNLNMAWRLAFMWQVMVNVPFHKVFVEPSDAESEIPRAPFQYRIRRLIVRSREVSKPRDW